MAENNLIEFIRKDRTCIIRFQEPITLQNISRYQNEFEKLQQDPCDFFVFMLDEIKMFSSLGIRLLISFAKIFAEGKKRSGIVTNPVFEELLLLSSMHRLYTIGNTLDEVLSRIKDAPTPYPDKSTKSNDPDKGENLG